MRNSPAGPSAPTAGARAMLLLASCAALLGACHPLPRTAAMGPRSGDEIVITAEQIAQYRVRTAWEAVKRGAPQLTYQQNSSGEPQSIQQRGRASLYLDQTPMLFVDGVHVSEISALQQIPSEHVARIRILTGLAATTEYGTHAGGGAILVETKTGET